MRKTSLEVSPLPHHLALVNFTLTLGGMTNGLLVFLTVAGEAPGRFPRKDRLHQLDVRQKAVGV